MTGPTPYLHLPGSARFEEFGRSDGPGDAIAHVQLLDAPISVYAADAAGDEPAFHAQGLMLSLLGSGAPSTVR